MLIAYKCCFCRKTYDWYDGLYENPKYDYDEKRRVERQEGKEYPEKSGIFVKVNGMLLKFLRPISDTADGTTETTAEPADGNLDAFINVCPDCMRKILDNLYCTDSESNAWDAV